MLYLTLPRLRRSSGRTRMSTCAEALSYYCADVFAIRSIQTDQKTLRERGVRSWCRDGVPFMPSVSCLVRVPLLE